MTNEAKNSLFSELMNEAPISYKVLYCGSREYLDKENNTTKYIYNFLFCDFEQKSASMQTFYVDKQFDLTNIDFLSPCIIKIKQQPGSKYSTLVAVESIKK